MTDDLNNLVHFSIGDWSGDGHEKYVDVYFKTNHTQAELQEGYRLSCKKVGIQFHGKDNDDFIDNAPNDCYLLAKYEEYELTETGITKLKEFGIDASKYSEVDDEIILGPTGLSTLLMDFIKLSIPNLKYEQYIINSKPINGCWGNLNIKIGYGLFM